MRHTGILLLVKLHFAISRSRPVDTLADSTSKQSHSSAHSLRADKIAVLTQTGTHTHMHNWSILGILLLVLLAGNDSGSPGALGQPDAHLKPALYEHLKHEMRVMQCLWFQRCKKLEADVE